MRGVGTGQQDACASPTVRSALWRYSPHGSLSEPIARPSPDQSPPSCHPLRGSFPSVVGFRGTHIC